MYKITIAKNNSKNFGIHKNYNSLLGGHMFFIYGFGYTLYVQLGRRSLLDKYRSKS